MESIEWREKSVTQCRNFKLRMGGCEESVHDLFLLILSLWSVLLLNLLKHQQNSSREWNIAGARSPHGSKYPTVEKAEYCTAASWSLNSNLSRWSSVQLGSRLKKEKSTLLSCFAVVFKTQLITSLSFVQPRNMLSFIKLLSFPQAQKRLVFIVYQNAHQSLRQLTSQSWWHQGVSGLFDELFVDAGGGGGEQERKLTKKEHKKEWFQTTDLRGPHNMSFLPWTPFFTFSPVKGSYSILQRRNLSFFFTMKEHQH